MKSITIEIPDEEYFALKFRTVHVDLIINLVKKAVENDGVSQEEVQQMVDDYLK